MFKYLLNVTAARPKYIIDDEFAKKLEDCCREANDKPNSQKRGYEFIYIGRLDEKTVQIELTTKTPVVATRAISSITRVLLTKISEDEVKKLVYNRNILKATIAGNSEVTYENMDMEEVAKTAIEILYRTMSLEKSEREQVSKYADQIRDVCIRYRTETSK